MLFVIFLFLFVFFFLPFIGFSQAGFRHFYNDTSPRSRRQSYLSTEELWLAVVQVRFERCVNDIDDDIVAGRYDRSHLAPISGLQIRIKRTLAQGETDTVRYVECNYADTSHYPRHLCAIYRYMANDPFAKRIQRYQKRAS